MRSDPSRMNSSRPTAPRRPRLASALLPACLLWLLWPCLGVAAQWQFQGLLQGDHTAFDSGAEGLRDDSELRRAEMVLKGSRGRWDWTAGYDLASRNDKWLDLNLRLKLIGERSSQATSGSGEGQLTLGQFKHYLGMEELTSSRHNDFIAKAMATSTFAIGRRLGAGATWSSGPWSLAGSGFGRELGSGGARGGGYSLRGVWAPVQGDGHIVHLGLSGLHRATDDDSVRLRARTGFEPASVPRLVDTGTFTAVDRIRTLGLEAAWVTGPVKFQGEYLDSSLRRRHQASDPDVAPGRDFNAHGWYLSGIWSLTGEPWRYRNGVFSPGQAGDAGNDAGRWQLAARIEGLDLDDGGSVGGHARVLTVGGNWYWREHLKLSLNHVRADVRRPDRNGQSPRALVARLQMHW